eukprot:6348763-Pyramimonas_sp.AAC.1
MSLHVRVVAQLAHVGARGNRLRWTFRKLLGWRSDGFGIFALALDIIPLRLRLPRVVVFALGLIILIALLAVVCGRGFASLGLRA